MPTAHQSAFGYYSVLVIQLIVTTIAFPGSAPITEGNTRPVEVAYLGTIAQNFTVTVESYRCNGSNIATRMYVLLLLAKPLLL